MMPDDTFFDYICDRCGAPVCERMQIMNLALDQVDELFCLNCLAAAQDVPATELAQAAREYVQARECFKTPWDNFSARALQCPRLQTHTCTCQD